MVWWWKRKRDSHASGIIINLLPLLFFPSALFGFSNAERRHSSTLQYNKFLRIPTEEKLCYLNIVKNPSITSSSSGYNHTIYLFISSPSVKFNMSSCHDQPVLYPIHPGKSSIPYAWLNLKPLCDWHRETDISQILILWRRNELFFMSSSLATSHKPVSLPLPYHRRGLSVWRKYSCDDFSRFFFL